MAENMSILDRTAETGNEEIKKIREEMRRNLTEHAVVSGDTIAAIAKNSGVDDYEDILALNRLMGKNLETKGKNGTRVTIKPWNEEKKVGDKIFVPKDLDKFQADIETIRQIDAAKVVSEGVAKGDRKILSREINERIFPKGPQSMGLAKTLDGFVKAQELQADPRLPRMVTPSRSKPKIETNASCAYFYKMFLSQTMNVANLRKDEKKLIQTKDIHAWIMPEKLIGIGFNQVQNLMGHFDPKELLSRSPIPSENQEAYRQDMLKLGNYLEKQGIPGSAMPIYFTGSSFLGETTNYNSKNKEKHYNTHMSIFARNADMKFKAYEFGEVKNGVVVPFGDDKERINREIARLKRDLEAEKSTYTKHETNLREAAKLVNNPDLIKRMGSIDKKIDQYVTQQKDTKKHDAMRRDLQELFATEDPVKIKNKLPGIINYPVNDADANFIIALQVRKRRILEGLERLGKAIEKKDTSKYVPFDATEYKSILAGSNVYEAFTRYNTTVVSIQKIEEQIAAQKQILADTHKLQVTKAAEREVAEKELAKLRPEFKKVQTENVQAKQELLDSLNPEKNKGLQERLGNVEKKILQRMGNDPGKVEPFMRALKANDVTTLMGRFRQSEADCAYLRTLLANKNKLEASIGVIKGHLGASTKGEQLMAIPSENLGRILGEDHPILQSLASYNKSVARVNGMDRDIALNEEKLKIVKEISAIDYMANFLQQRGDYSTSVMNEEGRLKMIEGMRKYASLIHLKVDGKVVDIAKELETPKSKRMKITPENTIEITGPMMVDGLHMFNSDRDRKEKMNARTRFFFEFAASGVFLPTELIEPGKDSSFRKEQFGKVTDSLKIKNVYDVRRLMDDRGNLVTDKRGRVLSENIAQVLKKNIPIFEKEAFAKLDVNAPDYRAQYDALIQEYYGLQIKALQMMGFMESEDRLNPGATSINRVIPYYDTANINKIFSTYIGDFKKQNYKTIEATAPYREFTHVKVLPGDTTASLHTRLVNSIEASKSQYKTYPNLAALSGFNDYLRGILWREIIAKGIQGESGKQSDFITSEDFISGKLRQGTSLVIHFKDLDEILGRLRKISHTPDISSRLRKVDNDVINAIVPAEQNRNLIRSTLFIETYEYPNDKWYVPDGTGKMIKTTLQNSELLQKIKKISSFGDFQIREIRGLASGFGNEFIRRDQLQRALNGINHPALQTYLSSNSPVIKEDMAKITTMREILKKPYPNDGDMAIISRSLMDILRIDPGDGSTIVGKIIGASLLNDKMNGHFQKFNGTLAALREPIDSFWNNKEKVSWYENSVFMINNRGEKVTTLGFAQNYLYRILEKTKILEQRGMKLKYGEIEFEHIGGIIGQVFLPDGISQRSIKYDTNIFIEHVAQMTKQSILATNQFRGTEDEKQLLSRLLSFGQNIEKIGTKYQKIFDTFNDEIRTLTGKRKQEMITVRNKFYTYRDGEIFGEIYRFVQDTEVKDILAKSSIDTSFLPTQEEWSKNDPFRYPLFNHARKANGLQRETLKRTSEAKKVA